MNTATQRRLVAVSALVTFTLGYISATAKGEVPSARFLIGIGVTFTLISVITDLGSPIGAGFALLIMLTALLTQGIEVFDFLNKRTGPKKKRRVSRQVPQGPMPNAPNAPAQTTVVSIPSKQFPAGSQTVITI